MTDQDPLVIIGLSGPMGAGKTEAARILADGYGFYPLAFADPIRECCAQLFSRWNAAHFERPLKDAACPDYGISPRDAMRAVGGHARGMDEQIYSAYLARRIAELAGLGCTRFVIHDVRFDAEADLVRYGFCGGLLAMPGARSALVHVERAGVAWAADHPSEVGPTRLPSDLRLQNAGGLDTYRAQIRALLSVVAPHLLQWGSA